MCRLRAGCETAATAIFVPVATAIAGRQQTADAEARDGRDGAAEDARTKDQQLKH